MRIQNDFEKAGFITKMLDSENDETVFKLNNCFLIFYIISNSIKPRVTRDFFEYVHFNNLDYAIIVFEKPTNKYYFLDFKGKVNWLEQSFRETSKDILFFGKQILDYISDLDDIIYKLKENVKK